MKTLGYTQLWLSQAQRISVVSITGMNYENTALSNTSERLFLLPCWMLQAQRAARLHLCTSPRSWHALLFLLQPISPTQQINSSQVYKSPSLPGLEESLQFCGVYLENQTVVALLLLSKGSLFLLFHVLRWFGSFLIMEQWLIKSSLLAHHFFSFSLDSPDGFSHKIRGVSCCFCWPCWYLDSTDPLLWRIFYRSGQDLCHKEFTVCTFTSLKCAQSFPACLLLDKVKDWEEIQVEASSNTVLHFLLGVTICFP